MNLGIFDLAIVMMLILIYWKLERIEEELK